MKAYRVAFTVIVDDNDHPRKWLEELVNDSHYSQDSLTYNFKELPLEEPGMTLNLYLLTQHDNTGYDTFDSIVVAAESVEEARLIGPSPDYKFSGSYYASWARSTETVNVKLLGVANPDITKGVVLASFNAG